MTKPFLAPGCYASLLTAQVNTPACKRCSYLGTCHARAQDAEKEVLAIIEQKLSVRSYEDADKVLGRVRSYYARRKRSVTVAATSNDRSDVLLRRFADERIDLDAIKRREVPFDPVDHEMFHKMTTFIVQGTPFCPKDVVEYLTDEGGVKRPASSLAAEVSRFLTALVSAKILDRKERRLLCLLP